MTHPDTLTIPRAVEPGWGPQQAYAEGRSAYENSMLLNTTLAVRFNELSSSEQAFWVAHAAFRAALQPQDAVTTSGPPERDNSKPAEQQGVFRKFNVQRTDGSDQPGGKHHGCEYFVLDVAHDQHAKPALEAYAVACATTHPQLSADMRERYGLQAQAAAEPVIPAGFALVPIRATTAMVEVFAEEGWEWANVLAAAEAVTEGEYEEALEGTPPATQAAQIERMQLTITNLSGIADDQQAALTAALGALKFIKQWGECALAVEKRAAAIAQIEALGE